MLQVLLPFLLLVGIALAVLVYATLIARRRGEEMLTPQGHATVVEAKRRSEDFARSAGAATRRLWNKIRRRQDSRQDDPKELEGDRRP